MGILKAFPEKPVSLGMGVVTLEEGIKLSGKPAEIPDCSRNDLPDLFKRLGFKAGVEIGVYLGEYTEVLARSGLQIYGVDPWKLYRDYGNPRGQKRLDDQYKMATERLAQYPNVKIIRKSSMEALEDFKDGSIDFVYIDGNHLFRYVAEDLYEWSMKVRNGGIVSGHDYAYYWPRSACGGCHVHQVVDAFVKAYHIPNFWVLGRRDDSRPDNEKRDKYRSWMWFKTYKMPSGE